MESKARVTIKGYDRPHLRKGSKCLGLVVHKGLCKRCKGLALLLRAANPVARVDAQASIIIATRSHVDRDFTEGVDAPVKSRFARIQGARNQSSAI